MCWLILLPLRIVEHMTATREKNLTLNGIAYQVLTDP